MVRRKEITEKEESPDIRIFSWCFFATKASFEVQYGG
jgi:hypothetical protein